MVSSELLLDQGYDLWGASCEFVFHHDISGEYVGLSFKGPDVNVVHAFTPLQGEKAALDLVELDVRRHPLQQGVQGLPEIPRYPPG